jgi:hypothetical protein
VAARTDYDLVRRWLVAADGENERYEERLPQITNDRFWTDREEAYANGRESELEDVISDLKAILRENKS